MIHDFEFFDRQVFDRCWQMPWMEFRRKYKTEWALNLECHPGVYEGHSLRELLAFVVEPEPSAEEIEGILDRRTVCWTLRRSEPQLFAMSSIMWSGLPHFRNRLINLSTAEIDPLIAVAVDAYLRQTVSGATLWAVLKLHSVVNLSEFLALTRNEALALKTVGVGRFMWQPIYKWQGASSLEEEDWANMLGVADTRRFVAFLSRAWEDNWPAPRLKEMSDSPRHKRRFRDFPISDDLAKPLRSRIDHLKRPCVFRRWN
jgi:hypothetical protein